MARMFTRKMRKPKGHTASCKCVVCKSKGGARRSTMRKPKGHTKGCKCVICRRC